MTAVAYGACLFVAALLIAASVTVRHRATMRRRLDAGILLPSMGARGRRGPGAGSLAVLAGAALLGGWLGLRLGGPVGGVTAAVGGPMAVRAVTRRRAGRVSTLEQEQLRDAVSAIASASRAGLSVRRSLEEAAGDVGPPLGPVLRSSVATLEVGTPLPDVLAALGRRVGSPDAQLLTGVLDIHRRAGGDLPVLLDELAVIVGQRARARREIRALTAQGRASAAVLAVLPVAFVTLLSGTSGDGLGAFYRTPMGATLLAGGLALDAAGFAWLRRILRGPR